MPVTLNSRWPVPTYAIANFPAAMRSGLLARASDGPRGLWMDTGVNWSSVTGSVLNVQDFGTIADGTSHPLSERYATLAAAQVDYPHATSLAQEIDWAAIQLAMDVAGPNAALIDLVTGSYFISSMLSISRGQRLVGASPSSSKLLVNGAITAVSLSSQYASIEHLGIYPATGSEYLFTGLAVTGSRHLVNNINIFQPTIGVQLSGNTYFNYLMGLYIYLANSKGIYLVTSGGFEPNNNTFTFKQISGHANAAGSIGIHVANGNVNSFHGGEVNDFDTNIYEAGRQNRFVNIYEEDSLTGGVVVTGGPSYFDIHSRGRVTQSGTGDLMTPYRGRSYFFDVDMPRPSWENLNALYLFSEDSGTLLHDYSGNERHATITGGSWVSGRYGPALHCTNFDKITLPTTAIDPASAWSVAIHVRSVSETSEGSGRVFYLEDGSNYFMEFVRNLATVGMTMHSYDGATLVQKNLNGQSHAYNRWAWVLFSYDPATETLTSIDPVKDDDAETLPSVVSTVSDIQIHNPGGNWVADFDCVAIWQRALSKAEILRFINQDILAMAPKGLEKALNATERLQVWVTSTNQNPSMGTLPANSYVVNVRMHVTELFDSDGTDFIRVGYDAVTNAFTTDTDVSAAGIKVPVLGAAVGFNATARAVEAYYLNGGSEPTQGKALVTLEYYRVTASP